VAKGTKLLIPKLTGPAEAVLSRLPLKVAVSISCSSARRVTPEPLLELNEQAIIIVRRCICKRITSTFRIQPSQFGWVIVCKFTQEEPSQAWKIQFLGETEARFAGLASYCIFIHPLLGPGNHIPNRSLKAWPGTQ